MTIRARMEALLEALEVDHARALLPELQKMRGSYKHQAGKLRDQGLNPGEIRKNPALVQLGKDYAKLVKKFQKAGGGGPAQRWVFDELEL